VQFGARDLRIGEHPRLVMLSLAGLFVLALGFSIYVPTHYLSSTPGQTLTAVVVPSAAHPVLRLVYSSDGDRSAADPDLVYVHHACVFRE
jgi:hypothetical protein